MPAAEPRLKRSITLHLKGDWGGANLHRACGWLSQQVGDRCGEHTRCAIWRGRGFGDNVRAVGRGEVDVALATPASFVGMGLDGRGDFNGEAFPDLVALGTVPQYDRLLLAVDASVGVHSFDDIRRSQVPLTIATGPDDGNWVGYSARRIMELSGISDSRLAAAGGGYVTHELPAFCIAAVESGQANAIFQEAIMTEAWQRLTRAREMVFVPIESEVLFQVEQGFGWARATLPANYFPNQPEAVQALDFSDFLLVARSDMADDLAHLIAWCLVETRAVFERGYTHIPPERSPVSYPLEATKIAQTTLPLHPAAAAYYQSIGAI